ncbi:hypothetical protein BaRGS_00029869 [Batillaria attramentaria]|uniref:RING-type domain-containing protein n=1 Tax=Batillaria attramentaria TaxID=370345 RepID=A0ABD0JWD5_9CAEN
MTTIKDTTTNASRDNPVQLRTNILRATGRDDVDPNDVLSRNGPADATDRLEHEDKRPCEDKQTQLNDPDEEDGKLSEATGGWPAEEKDFHVSAIEHPETGTDLQMTLRSPGSGATASSLQSLQHTEEEKSSGVRKDFQLSNQQSDTPVAGLSCLTGASCIEANTAVPATQATTGFHGYSVHPGCSDFPVTNPGNMKSEGRKKKGSGEDHPQARSFANAASRSESKADRHDMPTILRFRCCVQESLPLTLSAQHDEQHVEVNGAEDLRGINDSNAMDSHRTLPSAAKYVSGEDRLWEGGVHAQQESQGNHTENSTAQVQGQPAEELGACSPVLMAAQGGRPRHDDSTSPFADDALDEEEEQEQGSDGDFFQQGPGDDDGDGSEDDFDEPQPEGDGDGPPDVDIDQDIDLRRERRCLHCCVCMREVQLSCGHRNLCWDCFRCPGFWSNHLHYGPPRCLVCGEVYVDIYLPRGVVRFAGVRRIRKCGCGHRRG